MDVDSRSAFGRDDPFAELLSRLPATLDLDGLARATQAIQRRRGIRSGADLLRLGLAWGPGERSLRAAFAWSGLLGFAHLSDEALIQHLHKAVDFFEAITADLLRAAGGQMSWPGRQLRICDATSLSGPASQGTDLAHPRGVRPRRARGGRDPYR